MGAGSTIGWFSNASNRVISSLHSLLWTDAIFTPRMAQAIIIREMEDSEMGDIAVTLCVVARSTIPPKLPRPTDKSNDQGSKRGAKS